MLQPLLANDSETCPFSVTVASPCGLLLKHRRVTVEADLRESGRRMLNLRNLDLTTLPDSVTRLPIEVLKVSGNPLETFPDELAEMPNLDTLTMCDCKHLQELLHQLLQMDVKLSCLDLGNNKLDTIPVPVFSMRNLDTLMVRNNQLLTLCTRTDELAQLRKLRKLQIDRNNLETLGEEVLQLKETLEELHASQNPFRQFPIDVCQLTRLKVLNMFDCGFSSIPMEIGNLRLLEFLSLEKNKFNEFPAEVTQLRNLRELNLAHNHIQHVPDEIEELTEITELDLSENQLMKLNQRLFCLPKLQTLQLEDNKISELPSLDMLSTSVRSIDLSSNCLVELPATLTPEFLKSHSLKTLNVDRNPMHKPPLTICNRGLQSIADFNETLNEVGSIPCGYVSMLMFGESEAGKTSAVRSVMEDRPIVTRASDRTISLDVHRWHPVACNGVTVHVSDFGGHESYDVTTPFFTVDNSLCLLTFDLSTYRKECFDTVIGQWVKKICCFVKNAVIMIVGTHRDLCKGSQSAVDYMCQSIMKEIKEIVSSYETQLVNSLSEATEESLSFGRQCIHFGSEAPPLSSRIATLESVRATIQKLVIINDDVIQVSCKGGEYEHLVHNLRRHILDAINDRS